MTVRTATFAGRTAESRRPSYLYHPRTSRRGFIPKPKDLVFFATPVGTMECAEDRQEFPFYESVAARIRSLNMDTLLPHMRNYSGKGYSAIAQELKDSIIRSKVVISDIGSLASEVVIMIDTALKHDKSIIPFYRKGNDQIVDLHKKLPPEVYDHIIVVSNEQGANDIVKAVRELNN